MKEIAVIHIGDRNADESISLVGQEVCAHLRGTGGDVERARALIAEFDGRVDCIALDGFPAILQLGSEQRPHDVGSTLPPLATKSPVVDGSGIRGGLERWAVILADRAQPGIFAEKRTLLAPGLESLRPDPGPRAPHRSSALRRPDHLFRPARPAARRQPRAHSNRPPRARLANSRTPPSAACALWPANPATNARAEPFEWADVIAGDIGAIRRYAPDLLKRKTVVVEYANDEDLDDLTKRGVSIVVTLMPSLDPGDAMGRWSAAVVEATLVALRREPDMPLTEDTYLDLMADIQWTPGVRYLQPEEAGINRFSFVIHPLNVGFIHSHPTFRWTKYLPDDLVERIAAYMPPMYVSRITGGKSPTTGQRIEGYLYTLGATPRQMMKHDPTFTYKQLNKVARMAERKGARILGLGAFTSVVGDAGITIAHEADIAITSGNSLTVAMTLEAAKKAVQLMGATDLTKGKVMIVGATGSIASVCSRLIAQAIGNVVLVSIEPEKLLELKRTIQRETPGAEVTIATKAGDLISDCDLVITATSAFGQRVIDITKCKPGAVICDVARPPDINPAEAALRPDVLVIESGEVLIPGDIDFGYNIGLPPKTSYACLAETALLAMDGRFEDYTLGRNITMDRVKEIYKLSLKHGFQLAGLRSFEKYITDEDIAAKRALADRYRADPEYFAKVRAEAERKLQEIPVYAKGVSASKGIDKRWITVAAAVAGVLLVIASLGRTKKK